MDSKGVIYGAEVGQKDLKKYVKLTYRVAFPLELRLFNTVDDVEDHTLAVDVG